MGQNLTGKTIASTYEDLVQISGSIFTDGLGNDINNITITASFATTASYAANAAGVPLALFTASFSDPNLTFTKGDSSTFSIDLSALANGTSGTSGINGTNGSSGTSGTAGSSGTSGLVLALAARNYYFTASDFTYSYLGAPYNSSGSYVDVTFSQSFDPAYDYSIDVQYLEQAGSGWYDLSQAVVFAFTNKTNSGFRLWVLPSDIPTFNPDFECYVQAISLGEESPAGPAGSNGTSGSSGTSGVSGTNGSSGTSGVSGTDGSSGTSGATGPAGAPGTNGTSGSSGTSGVTGPAGTSGTSGISGASFPYTGNAVITGSLTVVGNYARVSGSYSGSLIDNLTTPTASEAIEHIVALSSAEYAAIVSPDPNTLYIIDSNSNPLVLGSTDFTGSVKITGSLAVIGNTTIDGTTIITGSLLQGATGNSVSDPNSAIIAAGNGNSVTATQAVIIAGVNSNTNNAGGGAMVATDGSTMNGGYGLMAGCLFSTQGGNGNVTLGGESHTHNGDDSAIVGGATNTINSGGDRSAIIAGKNNTVGAHTGSVILGGTGLSTTKNEEVVVPNLTVYGDLEGPGVYSPTVEAFKLQTLPTYTQTIDANTGGAIYNLHISESGLHYVSSSIASPGSASINVYWYLDLIPTGSSAAVVTSMPSGTAAVGLILRSITTGSSSTQFYVPSTSFNGTTNTSINRTTVVSPRYFPTNVANPMVFGKLYNGNIYMGTISNPVVSTGGQTYLYSGSIGSPIV